jgi:hypothetical protein
MTRHAEGLQNRAVRLFSIAVFAKAVGRIPIRGKVKELR